jgi:LysR family glycine cleavage system transcriptional activator
LNAFLNKDNLYQMEAATHLKSLQALDMALRTGSLKDAATALGITPAAVGQRIRSLETYLGVDLLMRSRSGLRATPELERALPDLQEAFAALDRVTRELDFQRVAEIHIVADPDWAELWLAPRLPAFRAESPNILFNINGEGDVRLRIGASDIRIGGAEVDGETLYEDRFVAVCTHENILRLDRHPEHAPLEGYPLLQLERRAGEAQGPEWTDWFDAVRHAGVGTGSWLSLPEFSPPAGGRAVGCRHGAGTLVAVPAGSAHGCACTWRSRTSPLDAAYALPAAACATGPKIARRCENSLAWLRSEVADTKTRDRRGCR